MPFEDPSFMVSLGPAHITTEGVTRHYMYDYHTRKQASQLWILQVSACWYSDYFEVI